VGGGAGGGVAEGPGLLPEQVGQSDMFRLAVAKLALAIYLPSHHGRVGAGAQPPHHATCPGHFCLRRCTSPLLACRTAYTTISTPALYISLQARATRHLRLRARCAPPPRATFSTICRPCCAALNSLARRAPWRATTLLRIAAFGASTMAGRRFRISYLLWCANARRGTF